MAEQGSDSADDGSPSDGDEAVTTAELRERVEAEYDFENFGPEDMAEMSAAEWEAAFDADSWITGDALLDRVQADLEHRVAQRDVFARIERREDDLVAYSDTGYAVVYPDGSVDGSGTVLRDVKPTVALCSMESYDVPDRPDGDVLPEPQAVPESSDALGNTVLQVIGGIQVLAGVILVGAWLLSVLNLVQIPAAGTGGLNLILILVAGIGFTLIGIFLFVLVANARLSDKFRAEEYRNRLRAIDIDDDELPAYLADFEREETVLESEKSSTGQSTTSGPRTDGSEGN